MEIKRKMVTKIQSNNPGRNLKSIDWITIHNTGNYASTAGAANHANFVFNGSGGGEASFHYCVDGKEIWQMFEDNQVCWHCGDGANGTGNNNSIGIEICVNDRAAFQKACGNAAWLAAELLKRHKLPIDRVVQHNKWSGKNCPMEIRGGQWGVTWTQFIENIKKNLNEPPKPSGTLITGKSILAPPQMAAFLLSKNPKPSLTMDYTALKLAETYISEGSAEGIRGDITFCQMMQETGYLKFGGDVLPEQNNYCGYGATNTTAKGKGAWFENPLMGVRCHIQHLKAYGSIDPLKNPLVQPSNGAENRFKYVTRGIAPNWEDLNGKWAVPGTNYGQSILKIYADMTVYKIPAETKYYRVQLGAFSIKANADKKLSEVKAKGFNAVVTPLGTDKLYKVQFGAFAEKKNADNTLAEIKKAGFADAIIKFE